MHHAAWTVDGADDLDCVEQDSNLLTQEGFGAQRYAVSRADSTDSAGLKQPIRHLICSKGLAAVSHKDYTLCVAFTGSTIVPLIPVPSLPFSCVCAFQAPCLLFVDHADSKDTKANRVMLGLRGHSLHTAPVPQP